jgi:SAM-dependent MidA family methyltransferase
MKTLAGIIRAEIANNGILSFARFMELALYCPDFGYYETQKDTVGRRGDFYTSASTGELFGELLAFQFANWLEELKITDRELRIVEAGAHDGKLAKDILNWLQLNRPELFERLEYCIIEPSARRREWQNETLKNFAPRVRWFSRLNGSTIQPFNGIIFSNELLDAFPVHRFGWDAENKNWFEWGVAVDGEKFIWERMVHSRFFHVSTISHMVWPWRGQTVANFDFPPAFFPPLLLLGEVLPDNYTIEISPAAKNWWRRKAGILQRGKLLAIDYGLTADELFSPARINGTLRGYFRHHPADDLLANVGEQDLTAHVNFSAIQNVGEEAGLKTEFFSTQTKFLTQILEKTLVGKSFGEWSASRTRQFQTLTHPEHLGRAFRVLVQSR